MKTTKRLAAALLALITAALCLASCGKKDEVIDIEQNPEYGASIDPATITVNQAKSVMIGIFPYAIWYQSFVTAPGFTTTFRLDGVDYTLEENEGYYPISPKYGLTSYDQLITGLNKYFTETNVNSLRLYLKGKDSATGKEVERFKMIGGVLHVYPEFTSGARLANITADYENFEITARTADSFTVRIGATVDDVSGTQEIRIKKIDGSWFVDGAFI